MHIPYLSELYHCDLLYTPIGCGGINVGCCPQQGSWIVPQHHHQHRKVGFEASLSLWRWHWFLKGSFNVWQPLDMVEQSPSISRLPLCTTSMWSCLLFSFSPLLFIHILPLPHLYLHLFRPSLSTLPHLSLFLWQQLFSMSFAAPPYVALSHLTASSTLSSHWHTSCSFPQAYMESLLIYSPETCQTIPQMGGV